MSTLKTIEKFRMIPVERAKAESFTQSNDTKKKRGKGIYPPGRGPHTKKESDLAERWIRRVNANKLEH